MSKDYILSYIYDILSDKFHNPRITYEGYTIRLTNKGITIQEDGKKSIYLIQVNRLKSRCR